MAFEVLENKMNRTAPTYVREQNDLILAVKNRVNQDKSKTPVDLFKFGKTKFAELGLEGDLGITTLIDRDLKKVYIATLPGKEANSFRGREGSKKALEAGYAKMSEALAEFGVIAADRALGYRAAFDLVPADTAELEGVKGIKGLENTVGLFVLEPTELVNVHARKAEDGEDDDESTEDVSDTAEGESEEVTTDEEEY